MISKPTTEPPPVARPQLLGPFLQSIAREIVERDWALQRIERELNELQRRGQDDSAPALQLIAESAVHRRELRRANAEIRALGCMLLSRRPPTIYIPERDAGRSGWLWQPSRDMEV